MAKLNRSYNYDKSGKDERFAADEAELKDISQSLSLEDADMSESLSSRVIQYKKRCRELAARRMNCLERIYSYNAEAARKLEADSRHIELVPEEASFEHDGLVVRYFSVDNAQTTGSSGVLPMALGMSRRSSMDGETVHDLDPDIISLLTPYTDFFSLVLRKM
jgi:hypothetical protein